MLRRSGHRPDSAFGLCVFFAGSFVYRTRMSALTKNIASCSCRFNCRSKQSPGQCLGISRCEISGAVVRYACYWFSSPLHRGRGPQAEDARRGRCFRRGTEQAVNNSRQTLRPKASSLPDWVFQEMKLFPEIKALIGSGGGTRTPDLRIMIPLL